MRLFLSDGNLSLTTCSFGLVGKFREHRTAAHEALIPGSSNRALIRILSVEISSSAYRRKASPVFYKICYSRKYRYLANANSASRECKKAGT